MDAPLPYYSNAHNPIDFFANSCVNSGNENTKQNKMRGFYI